MNRLIILFAFLFTFCTPVFSQNKAQNLPQDTTLTKPQITFINQVYDFGKIRKGEKIITSFHFKNTGTKPLVILQVQVSCGCTATTWTKGKIEPNQTGEIEVVFDSGMKDNMLGKQSKVLLVISNAINKETKLTLDGEVVDKEANDNN